MSTQQGFGRILNELARSGEPLADRIVTTSPDVTVSTNLGAWVNRRGLFAREEMKDTFKAERIPSTYAWEFGPKGQHIELGIAEMNLFIMLSALGLSHSLFGERLIPIGTLYDPFIARGLDALNYACYQDARFILVATPSGVTLAPEGGAHQSIGTPLIGMAQDGLASFEPAFVDELAEILRWAFAYVQRSGEREIEGAETEGRWLREETGGSVYLRLSTRVDRAAAARDDGGAVAATSSTAPIGCASPARTRRSSSPMPAPSRPRRSRRSGSWPRTAATSGFSPSPRPTGSTPAGRRRSGRASAGSSTPAATSSGCSRICRPTAASSPCSTAIRRRSPGSAPSAATARARSASSISARPARSAELYRHYGIDAQGIVAAAEMIAPGRPIRHLRALG